MTSRANQIPLIHSPPPEDSIEIARLWVQHRGPSFVYINAHSMPDPGSFGLLLADTAMQAAKAYSQAHGMSEAAAMARIWEVFDTERQSHSGDIVIGGDETAAGEGGEA
jgi:hypothetical protein